MKMFLYNVSSDLCQFFWNAQNLIFNRNSYDGIYSIQNFDLATTSLPSFFSISLYSQNAFTP